MDDKARVREAVLVAVKLGLAIVLLPCYPDCRNGDCHACKLRGETKKAFDESKERMDSIDAGIL